ncbi:MAG: DNA-binding CsgD family transcriptional regulator [Sulfitobacter sp.]|jgi:DNA-binding CsgD family transcriptional regulator
MRMQETIDDLIRQVYMAPFEAVGWEQFFTSLVATTGSKGGILSIADGATGCNIRPKIFLGVDEELVQDWANHYIEVDPWIHTMVGLPLDRFYRGDDIYPRGQFLKSEIFNDFLRKNDIYHAIGGRMIIKETDATVQYVLQRSSSQGEHSGDELLLANLLTTHIKQAIWLEDQFTTSGHPATAMLESLVDAAFLCSADRRVHQINQAADALVRQRGPVRLQSGVLSIMGPSGKQFACTVRESSISISNARLSKVTRLEDHGRLYSIRVVPWLLESTSLLKRNQLVLVIVKPLDSEVAWTSQAAAAFFAFTSREADVARLLAVGMSPIEVAQKLEITESTVRSHIKALLHKTDVRSLQNFVSLLRSLDSSFK